MNSKMKEITKKIFSQREVTVFLIIVLVIVITSIIQPKFLNSNNLRSIALSVSVDGLFAIGLTFALILGGIELSVGAVSAMTCVIAGYLALHGVNIWVACIASIASGLIVGLFNGFMISKIGLPPFIVTLGMENLARGMAYIITTGSPLSVSGYLPDSFRYFATGSILGIPVLFIIFILVSAVTFIFMKYSKVCRNMFYVGSNEHASRLSGINVDKVKIGVYVLIAIISTMAGLLSLGRFNVATPELSKGAETTAISAAVIGGTSMTGGVGGVLGTVLGIFLLKIVNSALVMMNVSVYWQEFVQGAILVLAVTIDYLSQRRRGKTSYIMKFFGLDKIRSKTSK